MNASGCYNPSTGPTVLQGNRFGGIPTVLLISFLIFLFLILVFSFLRKVAWDYGRLAIIPHHEGEATERSTNGAESRVRVFSGTLWMNDAGFCSWLTRIFTLRDEEIREQCGDDAIQYLSFQRYVIVLLTALSVLSVAVILPVNLSGSLHTNDPISFGRTTIANMKTDNNLLWLHTVFAVIYLLLTIFIMKHHTSRMQYTEDHVSKCTLFIAGIPKGTSEDTITQYFSEAYPTVSVLDVQRCYDVARLIKVDVKRRKVERSGRYYTDLLQREGQHVRINTKPCGQFCCCDVSGCERVDAVEYYSGLKERVMEEFEREKERAESKPLDLAFVTFQDTSMATLVLRDFNTVRCHGCTWRAEPQPSSFSQTLHPQSWTVSYAPESPTIYWENISVHGIRWWSSCLIINFFLFILLFFLTTPSIVLSTMDKFNVTKPIEYLNSPIISQFSSTFLLWTFSALLPILVLYSSLLERHWTRSAENRITMHKLYTYLIIMVLILPSLGLTSLDVFFRWLFDKKFLENGKIQFECVFLPDQGAFFVNYVIASAFIGNGMELLRLPQLLLYTGRMILAKTAAERSVVKQHQAIECEFGASYAWMLCSVTVVVAYSITCPIIVPFGLIYTLLKHMVDRHNLYYSFLPTRLDRRIHSAAVKQLLAAPIICLCWLLFFSVLRGGVNASTSIFTFFVLVLTILACLAAGCFGFFKRYFDNLLGNRPPDQQTPQEPVDTTMKSDAYTPRVLRVPLSESSPLEPRSQKSYGTLEEQGGQNLDDSDDVCLVEAGSSEV
eukprot:gi/632953618/ref/XP_007892522.1/ PREDICTED: transmembrane protein 63A-like isoform X2 [Callorhinchus milii]